MNLVFLSLGSNLGEREFYINSAVQQLDMAVGTVLKQSSFYYSAPEGFDSTNDFCNVVVKLETALTPLVLLEKLQRIENNLGRTQKSIDKKYTDRLIDIDIIFFNDIKININNLIIPHPQWQNRKFVTIPLGEVQ